MIGRLGLQIEKAAMAGCTHYIIVTSCTVGILLDLLSAHKFWSVEHSQGHGQTMVLKVPWQDGPMASQNQWI